MKRLLYVYPFLFGVYPLLNVFGVIDGFGFVETLRLSSMTILLTLVVLIIGKRIDKLDTFAVGISFFWIWFFYYKSIEEAVVAISFIFFKFSYYDSLTNTILPTVYFLFLVVAILIIAKMRCNFEKTNKILLFISVIMICLTIPSLFINENNINNDAVDSMGGITHTPDIYIIILDKYAGAEGQKTLFGKNESYNLKRFGRGGFKILNYYSNYYETQFSMSSLFNMNYVNTTKNSNFEQTKVMDILKQYNYTTVHIGIGYWALDNTWNSDYEYIGEFNTFEITVMDKIYFSQLFDVYNKKEHMKFINDSVSSITNIKSPKIVYIHVESPHQPYVFSEGIGVFNDSAYKLEVEGTSLFAEGMISKIPSNDSVIIVLSDHGSKLSDENGSVSNINKYSALFAYKIPDGMKDPFYENMTTVNVFRVLLSEMGGNITKLKDCDGGGVCENG